MPAGFRKRWAYRRDNPADAGDERDFHLVAGIVSSGVAAGSFEYRARQPEDKTLAAITVVGTACWGLLTFAFAFVCFGSVQRNQARAYTRP